MRKSTVVRQIYDYLLKHWILSSFILSITSHWFIVVRVAGKNLNLINDSGALNTLGNWITWPLISISILFTLSKTAGDRYNEQAKKRGGYILQKMIENVNSVTEKKMRRLTDFIEIHPDHIGVPVFNDITQPKSQIRSLLENIQITLSEIFGIERDQIGLSILYRYMGSGEWNFLEALNNTHELDVKTLISNPNTTVRQVIDGKQQIFFFPKKIAAIKIQHYLPSSKDYSFDNVGSIFCQDISLRGRNETCYLQAILSISTYGKQLCPDNDEGSRNKFLNVIIPVFEIRLQLELATLYIKDFLKPRCRSCDL